MTQLFNPDLTPRAMFEAGVFGGSYFASASDEDLDGLGDVKDLALAQRGTVYDIKKNAYRIRAGDSYEEWMKRGLIFPEDPLGWFHWYCRFHAGRVHSRDQHQITRWSNYGERWIMYARRQFHDTGRVSPRVNQSFLHWAYEPLRITERF